MNPQRFILPPPLPNQGVNNGPSGSTSPQHLATPSFGSGSDTAPPQRDFVGVRVQAPPFGNVILDQSSSTNVNFLFGHPGTYNVRMNMNMDYGGAGRGGRGAQHWGQGGGGHQARTQPQQGTDRTAAAQSQFQHGLDVAGGTQPPQLGGINAGTQVTPSPKKNWPHNKSFTSPD